MLVRFAFARLLASSRFRGRLAGQLLNRHQQFLLAQVQESQLITERVDTAARKTHIAGQQPWIFGEHLGQFGQRFFPLLR